MVMNRKAVRLKFVDGYPGFKPEESALYKVIAQFFDIVLCENPDYIITQPYGREHLKYNCLKIFFTGENMTPDFNLYDYAIGFDHLSLGDRYVRVPLWAIRSNFRNFRESNCPSDEALLNRGFCSFVVSNSQGDPIRMKFVKELSKYKKVDSGGWCMNNVGGPVKDKLPFLAKYKFNIAFENSAYPGYTTEKIMDPLSAWSVPIYWGDPMVGQDFQVNSFVEVKSLEDIERAIEEIIRLDNDDEAYLRKCKMACLVNQDKNFYLRQMSNFLKHVFDQPLANARRLASYGYQGMFYRPTLIKAYSACDMMNIPVNCYRKIRKLLRACCRRDK